MSAATGTGDDLTALLQDWGERTETELNRSVGDEALRLAKRAIALQVAVESVLNLPGRLSRARIREAVWDVLAETEESGDA